MRTHDLLRSNEHCLRLQKAFPSLFDHEGLISVNYGPGWDYLVRALCVLLNENPRARVAQVKEKFGCLRFYADGLTEKEHDVVSAVESLSASTCEACGEMEGVVFSGSWIKALCADCRKGWDR